MLSYMIFISLWFLFPVGTSQIVSNLYTIDGYDTVVGERAICWKSQAGPPPMVEAEAESNGLVSHYSTDIAVMPDLIATEAAMMRDCPKGTDVHLDPPPEVEEKEILRTGRTFQFRLFATVNLTAIKRSFGLSHNVSVFPVAGRVVFCPPNGNLCSPFIVSQTSAAMSGALKDHGDGMKSNTNHSGMDGMNPKENGGMISSHNGTDGENLNESGVMESTTNHSVTDGMDLNGHGGMESNTNHSGMGSMGPNNHQNMSYLFPKNITRNRNRRRHRGPRDQEAETSHSMGDNLLTMMNQTSGNISMSNHSGMRRLSGGMVNQGDFDENDRLHDHQIRHDDFDLSILNIVNASSSWMLQSVEEDSSGISIVDMTFEIFIDQPGSYLPLAVIQLLLGDENNSTSEYQKIDIANLLHSTNLQFQPEPAIRYVAMPVKIIVWVAIAIASWGQIWLLQQTIKHRNESVMKLSQGRFLILVQVSALIASIFSFTFEPRNDTFCNARGPLTLIPMQFMLAIIFGRLLRATTIMGDLMAWNQPQSSSALKARLHRLSTTFRRALPRKSGGIGISTTHSVQESEVEDGSTTANSAFTRTRQKVRKLRRKFPVSWLWGVIIAVTLPQVIMELVGLIVFPQVLVLRLNDDKSIGRYDCSQSNGGIMYSMITLLLLFVTLVATIVQANKSRNLPALFNEASSVSTALFTTLALSTLAFTLVVATYPPTSSPDVQFVMLVLIILNFTLNSTIRLVLPKLKLIWKGEKVVISDILRKHIKKQPTEQRPPISGSKKPDVRTASSDDCESALPHCEGSGSNDDVDYHAPLADNRSEKSLNLQDVEPSKRHQPQVSSTAENKIHDSSLVIRDGYAPPPDLTLNVVRLNRTVAKINERVLSGLVVSKDDWECFRSEINEVQSLLQNTEFCE